MAGLGPNTLTTGVDPMRDFAAFLKSDLFTFLVGPAEEKFVVHSHAISKHSKILDRMMANGKMTESVTKTIKLPEVDADTFTRVASFCYAGDYDVATAAARSDESSTKDRDRDRDRDREGNEDFRLRCRLDQVRFAIHLLAGDRLRSFYCTVCGKKCWTDERNPLYPFCSLSHADMANAKTQFCVSCAKHIESGTTTVCAPCFDDFLKKYPNDEGIAPRMETMNVRRGYDLIIQNYFSNHDLIDRQRQRNVNWIPSRDLMSHAKLYIFAEMYGIEELQIAALIKLSIDLSHYEAIASNVRNIIELGIYVDQNTHSSSELLSPIKDPLKDMVVDFMVKNRKKIMNLEEGAAWIVEGGRLAADFVRALAMRF